jgi:hypothetical protein
MSVDNISNEVKDFYSKVCVVSSLKFALEKENETPSKDKFLSSLAKILERDKEVIAIKLTIINNGCIVYLSKNGGWLPDDKEYFVKIEKYLTDISKDAPMSLKKAKEREDTRDFYINIMTYCADKFQSRYDKLMNYIIAGQDYSQIIDFLKYASMDIENIAKLNKWKISELCMIYYEKVKNNDNLPIKFLEYMRKVGSYANSFTKIVECACRKKYKLLFSNMTINMLAPVKVCQSINSWEDVVQEFIPDADKYKIFKDRCLEHRITANELKHIYGEADNQLNSEIKNDIYLHATTNMISHIINLEISKNASVVLSKICCYLCDLYVKYVNENGYKIHNGYRIVTGSFGTNKMCHRWMLPSTKDITFDNKFRLYVLEKLGKVINNEIKILTAKFEDSDNEWEFP